MLIILFGKAVRYDVGIFHKNPAKTIRSGAISLSSWIILVLYSSLLNTRVETPWLAARARTPAFGLLQKIFSTEMPVDALKNAIIFAAFVPDPDAKTTIFFKT